MGETDGGAGWMSILRGLFGGGDASAMAGQADPKLMQMFMDPSISPTLAAPPVGDDSAGSFASLIDPAGSSAVPVDAKGQSTNQLLASMTGQAWNPDAPSGDSKTAPTMGQTAGAAAKKFAASADTLSKLAAKPPPAGQTFQTGGAGAGDGGKTITPNNYQAPTFTPGQRLTLSQLIYGR